MKRQYGMAIAAAPAYARSWAVLALLVPAAFGGAAAEAADYRLGPQDQLQIRVFDLRAGTGQAYEWPAFNGPFSVNAAGKVSLPLLGEVDAGDRTTAALAQSIAEKLQAKVGLADRPDASVQVTKYRPFYVTGSVEKAGAYEYQPDLTVLQAVSIAGGSSRATGDTLLGFEREALSSRGDLRVMAVQRLALLARQARLDAEIGDAGAITLPAEVTAHMNESDVARLVREEQMLFEARAYSIRSQAESLHQAKLLLQSQVESLQAKDATLAKQLDIVKSELDQVSSLVAKGLAVLPRQLAIEQNTAQFQSDRLDVQLATLRARQDMSKTDRDLLELTNNRRNEALQEATEVRNRLAETAERMETAQRLLLQAEVRAPTAVTEALGATAHPTFALTRIVNGMADTRPVVEGDLVEPGDVVRVEIGVTPGAAGSVTSRTASSILPVN